MSRLNQLARAAFQSIAARASVRSGSNDDARPGLLGEVVTALREALKRQAVKAEDDEQEQQSSRPWRETTEDEDLFNNLMSSMRLVNSSNVYGYFFDAQTKNSGTLYVTFLHYVPKDLGGDGKREGPGATYAYYDFPFAKFTQFQAMAATSAGSAVWDYCRVRHSAFEHQHTYRLVQAQGDYVPRKATAWGYRARQTAGLGLGKRNQARNKNGMPNRAQQLPEQQMTFRRALPNRGTARRETF